jgi:hypothetical protein
MSSTTSPTDKFREFRQRSPGGAKGLQGSARQGDQFIHPPTAFGYSQQRRVRHLPSAAIFAEPLSDAYFLAVHVQQVVDNLKRVAQMLPISCQRLLLSRRRVGRDRPQLQRSPEQGARFAPMY